MKIDELGIVVRPPPVPNWLNVAFSYTKHSIYNKFFLNYYMKIFIDTYNAYLMTKNII